MPAFQFYPGDWMKDPAVRSCSLPARALWFDMLCLMFESPRRGFLQHQSGEPMSAAQLTRIVGCAASEVDAGLSELENAGVFSRTDAGVIFNRRMVRDENKRSLCAEAGRRGGGNPTLKGHPKGHPKVPPKVVLEDEDEGDLGSVSSGLKPEIPKLRAECAPEVSFDDETPLCKALREWSLAAKVPWNSACWHAVATWEAQTLPALSMPTGPADTLPKIVGVLRRKGMSFTNVRYVLAALRSSVEQWHRTSVPPWETVPSGGGQAVESSSDRAERIAARVEARIKAKGNA